jgi:hypothetical protein
MLDEKQCWTRNNLPVPSLISLSQLLVSLLSSSLCVCVWQWPLYHVYFASLLSWAHQQFNKDLCSFWNRIAANHWEY